MLPHTLQPALAVAVATGAHPPFSASFYHFVLQHPELVLREEHRDVVCGTEGTIVSALLQKHVTTTAAQRRVCASFKPKLRKESTRSKRPLALVVVLRLIAWGVGPRRAMGPRSIVLMLSRMVVLLLALHPLPLLMQLAVRLCGESSVSHAAQVLLGMQCQSAPCASRFVRGPAKVSHCGCVGCVDCGELWWAV